MHSIALLRSMALGAVVSAVIVMPASAAGCVYPAVTAQGPIRSNIQSARYASMAAWDRKAARRWGRRYGRWGNAIDQTVDCVWNDRGNRIRCKATASACTF